MKRPPLYIVAVSARWVACGIAAALLAWQAGTRVPLNGTHMLLLSYSMAYTACWAWLLRRWHTRVRDGSLLFFYDLLLSALPMWMSGGWRSPFLPVALAALVVPALNLRWRNGLVAAACFTVLDQAVLWSTATTPWQLTQTGQAAPLLARTLLPYAVVLALTGAVRMWHGRQREKDQRQRALPRPSRPMPPLRSNLPPAGARPPSFARSAPSAVSTQTLSPVAAQRPQTVRRVAPTLQALLRQLRGELETASVVVTLHVHGDDALLPPQIQAIALRALDVAVDNVLAHAHAKSVVISVQIDTDSVQIDVADDGDGLWDGTAEPPGFHQVKRLRYRAQELGGTLTVAERPEGGVALHMYVPIK